MLLSNARGRYLALLSGLFSPLTLTRLRRMLTRLHKMLPQSVWPDNHDEAVRLFLSALSVQGATQACKPGA